jgi:hypothetical protein
MDDKYNLGLYSYYIDKEHENKVYIHCDFQGFINGKIYYKYKHQYDVSLRKEKIKQLRNEN